jgi:hypothetical protein
MNCVFCGQLVLKQAIEVIQGVKTGIKYRCNICNKYFVVKNSPCKPLIESDLNPP